MFVNSQFFLTAMGALTGACGGAYAAHKIGSNARKREDLEAEIRAVNQAINATFLTSNKVLSIKSQFIKRLTENFNSNRNIYIDALNNPPPPQKIHFEMDMETFSLPMVPFERAAEKMQEKISVSGRTLALPFQISEGLVSLERAIDARNNLIDEFREKIFPTCTEMDKLSHYFGLQLADGNLDNRYQGSISAIRQCTDDLIFFSSLLCLDLVEYGEKLRASYIKKYGRTIAHITKPNFDTEKARPLMPDSAAYDDWLSTFQPADEKSSRFDRALIELKNFLNPFHPF